MVQHNQIVHGISGHRAEGVQGAGMSVKLSVLGVAYEPVAVQVRLDSIVVGHPYKYGPALRVRPSADKWEADVGGALGVQGNP